MRILTKHSTQFKIGIVIIVLCAGAALYGSLERPASQSSQLAQASTVSATTAKPQTAISEKPKLDIIQTTVETTEVAIPYETTQTYDGTLPKDTSVVRVDGADGKKIVKTQVKSKDGIELSRDLISEEVTVPPITKVVAIGTKVTATKTKHVPASTNCNPNYTPCIPNVGGSLDCKDIGFQVKIIGTDQYNLDTNGDGSACENYPSSPSL